jgi:hypothetical protein
MMGSICCDIEQGNGMSGCTGERERRRTRPERGEGVPAVHRNRRITEAVVAASGRRFRPIEDVSERGKRTREERRSWGRSGPRLGVVEALGGEGIGVRSGRCYQRERGKPSEMMKPTGGLHPSEREGKRFGMVCWAIGVDSVLGRTGRFGLIPFLSFFFFFPFILFCFHNSFITFA